MEAAFGRLHNNGGAAFGGPPIVVESIMVAFFAKSDVNRRKSDLNLT